jgi:serine/threonine-protein kinase
MNNSLLASGSIVLIYFICLIPNVDAVNSSSTVQKSIYEDPDMGIRIEYPANWKPFERTSSTTNANIIEFVPIVESEHDPLTPFFSISVEDLDEIGISNKSKTGLSLNVSNDENALKVLTERNFNLAESLPGFNVVELNRTYLLSNTPAHKIIYTFEDPGSPLHPVFESMSVWTVRDNRAYTISFTADKSGFLDYLPTAQDMLDSFSLRGPPNTNSLS